MVNRKSYLWIGMLSLLSVTFWWQRHAQEEIPTSSFHAPMIESWETQRGTQVYFVHTDQLPMVDIALVFRAGSVFDGAHLGLGELVNSLIGESTQSKTERELANALDRVGAQVMHEFDQDVAGISLRSLSNPDYLDPAVTLFAEIVTQPLFTEALLKKAKRLTLTQFQFEEEQPGIYAEHELLKRLFGTHGYSHPPEGTQETIRSISLLQLKKFYEEYYTARNAFIAIVGNMTRSQAEVTAEKIVSGLREGKKYEPPEVKPPVLDQSASEGNSPRFQEIHQPFFSQQTHIMLGELGVNQKSQSYFPLLVGNYVLGGGGMTSQLFKTVRDQKGLAYSVKSHLVPLAQSGIFLISMQTRTEKGEEAKKTAVDIFKLFLQTGVTREELQGAKAYFLRSYPLEFIENGLLLNHLLTIGTYELPLDFMATYPARIEAVTQNQIKEAFKQQFGAGHLAWVVTVGPS